MKYKVKKESERSLQYFLVNTLINYNTMKNKISIKQSKRNTSKIEEFEKNEWEIADIEHYGKGCVFNSVLYKFIANDVNGNIIGVLELKIELNVAYLNSLLVSSKNRREGIGKKLLLFAEDFSKKKWCTKIWLDTDEDWDASIFYKSMDYEITWFHENHYLGKKSLIFTKYL